VVYAGSFDFAATDMGPDLDLSPAKAWLGATPQAQVLRPAAYVNGTRGLCGANHIYALEVKGAPFEQGYVWGSAAAATITPAGGELPSAALSTPSSTTTTTASAVTH
jgi:hypothetical protein